MGDGYGVNYAATCDDVHYGLYNRTVCFTYRYTCMVAHVHGIPFLRRCLSPQLVDRDSVQAIIAVAIACDRLVSNGKSTCIPCLYDEGCSGERLVPIVWTASHYIP